MAMEPLFELLENIKNKPGIYIGKASVTELRMFIVGYRFARSELKIELADAERDFHKNFQPWLQIRLNVHTSNSWDKILLFTVIDEKQAFQNFFQLLDEFRARDQSTDIDPLLFDLNECFIADRQTA
jgi:hypothetical protein